MYWFLPRNLFQCKIVNLTMFLLSSSPFLFTTHFNTSTIVFFITIFSMSMISFHDFLVFLSLLFFFQVILSYHSFSMYWYSYYFCGFFLNFIILLPNKKQSCSGLYHVHCCRILRYHC